MVAIQQETTVEPGGVIRIRSDKLAAGSRARVTVIVDQPAGPGFPTMRSLIGAAPGGYKSPAEIDAFLHGERDAWQR
jgi:hypothetical protein